MKQLELFDLKKSHKGVNVATVPMRSPFRYPGGKTWLIPQVRLWLKSLGSSIELIEPFVGGGIVSLTAAFENLAKTILMVEKDEDIAAVWRTILGREGKWLADQIMQFEVTLSNVQAIFNQPITSVRQRAFTTILKNRLFHGGILAEGSGLLKYGENGKGLLSRWYPKTLQNRILAIQPIKQKILFVQGDGFKIMKKNKNRRNVAYFIDPPYTKAAKRLYRHFEINHQYLFDLTKQLKGDFLMTYDDTEEIRLLARKHCFDIEPILMRGTHHIKKTELLIGNNLDWLREDF